MKCVLLAGGLGTRLSEETVVRPKPMVEIGGKPILWHIMKIYSHYGINEFIICLGYKGYLIKEYFANYFLHMSDITLDMKNNKMEVHNQYAEPWKVTLINTGDDSMTGGRLRRAREYIKDEEAFCLTYGDGVSDINISQLIDFHKSRNKLATLTAVTPPGRFGALDIRENHIVSSFKEKPKGDGAYINGGFFVLSPKVLDLVDGDDCIWEQDPLRYLASSGQLSAYTHDGFWQPMDTLRDKQYLEELWHDNSTLETLEMIDKSFWANKKVLITGRTGFKGSWLATWLIEMGADVYGYSLPSPTNPSMFDLLNLQDKITYHMGDIREYNKFSQFLNKFNPEIVFHLAAQPLVRYSYDNPIETYHTNVLGLVNILEAIRHNQKVRAIVNVTSDKCYENKEWHWGYRENEPFGGYDPYSNSKGCAELVTSCYRNSYFNVNVYGTKHNILIASGRAGSVIGGGDWAADRLIADIMQSFLNNSAVQIRNPLAIRPWQHVLEPLSGYILLAQKLYNGETHVAKGWNFGPHETDVKNVEYIVKQLSKLWGHKASWQIDTGANPHEANYLKLDCSMARDVLGWHPRWNLDTTLNKIIDWYGAYQSSKDLYALTVGQINDYTV